jgi:hypothetical protein
MICPAPVARDTPIGRAPPARPQVELSVTCLEFSRRPYLAHDCPELSCKGCGRHPFF